MLDIVILVDNIFLLSLGIGHTTASWFPSFSDEKSAINPIVAPLYIMSQFSLTVFKIFAFSLAFSSFNVMCLCVNIFVFSNLEFVELPGCAV